MPRLKPEIKAKWLAALRSGEYKQTQGTLHYRDRQGNDSYCCLGVLCEITENCTSDYDEAHEQFVYHYGSSSSLSSDTLPFELAQEIGEDVDTICVLNSAAVAPIIKDLYPSIVKGMENETALSELNDEGVDFLAIADIIDKLL